MQQHKFLFFAISDSQQYYYNALLNVLNLTGEVLTLKHMSSGSARTGKAWVIEHDLDCVNWLAYKLEKEASNRHFFGLLRLFQVVLKHQTYQFVDSFVKEMSRVKPNVLVVFNGAHYKQQAAINIAKYYGSKIIYLELGCLPNTTAVDDSGVNFLNSLPRDASFYNNYKPTKLVTINRQLVVRESIKLATIMDDLPARYVFAPFQVHDDTQILIHSPWLKSMPEFYHVLEQGLSSLNKDIGIVIKEHPTDKKSFEELHYRNPRIIFANGNNTADLIKNSEAVITINSTVGIEALLLNKSVVTTGNAFYNIDGLVTHVANQQDLNLAFARLNDLIFDPTLVENFIYYLIEQYLVQGQFKDFTDQHIMDMGLRINKILCKHLDH